MSLETYNSLKLKMPDESASYPAWSEFVVKNISEIIKARIRAQKNKIFINTNLKLGLPMENINKIAGPFVEAWAYEVFSETLADPTQNTFHLVNVEARERLNMADVVLQFKCSDEPVITSNIDVKATSQDIVGSGKSPNITSFARIRSAYIEDPDYIFIILSLKHKVYSTRDAATGMMNGIMEIVDQNAYDLKYLSHSDISYNPALGSGQLQIRDIHYVETCFRTAKDFCVMLDKKVISSKKGYVGWLGYAKQNDWIKEDE